MSNRSLPAIVHISSATGNLNPSEISELRKELRNRFHYNPDTGVFYRTVKAGKWEIGPVSGSKNGDGYRQIGIKNRRYLSSRLAWLFMTGSWPEAQVEHKNRNRADDRFCNLRLATPSQNAGNRAVRVDAKSGLKGVRSRNGKWQSRIFHLGNRINIGTFATPEEASAAHRSKAIELFGEFARQS